MTNHGHLRFGPESPESLLICGKGGWPQSLEKSWSDWIIQNFREMSDLEFLASEGTRQAGDKVASYQSLREWAKSNRSDRLVYIDARGEVVTPASLGDGSAKFPVSAHEAGELTGGRAVVFPNTEGRIYGTASIDVINEILQTEQPDRAYGFFFSRWASAYRERVCQEVYLDGAVVCSGIDAPTEFDRRPPKVGRVIVLHESKPYRFWFASNEERANELYDYFAAHAPTFIVQYPGRHSWPKSLNAWLVEELDIPA